MSLLYTSGAKTLSLYTYRPGDTSYIMGTLALFLMEMGAQQPTARALER